MKKPVIIDCDPGNDDAVALLMAFASNALSIKAVTAVAGNQTLDKTLNNALAILSYAGIDVPVAAGADRPLIKNLVTAPEIHGENGLAGPALPQPSLKPVSSNAIDLMADVAEKNDNITIIPTGPLTNIALFLLTHPELKNKIARISLMGGACFGGNRTPSAEFNIWTDPEAADIVFRSGIPITMCGLDVTNKALIYKEEVEKIRGLGHVCCMLANMLDAYGKNTNIQKGLPLHDPCAVAWAIDPTIFTTKRLHVDIELHGEFTTGKTVVDYREKTGRKPNTDVAFDIDRKRFIDLLTKSMACYN